LNTLHLSRDDTAAGSHQCAGGLAIDKHGNIYYSDQGDGSLGNGVIKMIPKETNTPITILTGLDIPGDIELTRDGRRSSLPRLMEGKAISFGLAAHFEGPDGTPTYGLTLYANIPGVGMTKGYRVMINDFYLLRIFSHPITPRLISR